MKQALVVGGDDFLITAMRIALRHAPGIQALGVLDRGGSVRRAIRDASPELVLIEAPADRDLALTRLQELDDECPEALVLLVAAELDVEVFEDAARREMVACLAGPGLGPMLRTLLAQPADDAARSGRIRLASADPAPPSMPDDPWGMQPACPLTPRQLEILRAVAEGQTNAEIARKLWLTEQTVKFHLSKIYRRLGVSNRTEASRYALLGGWPGAAAPVNEHRVLSGALH